MRVRLNAIGGALGAFGLLLAACSSQAPPPPPKVAAAPPAAPAAPPRPEPSPPAAAPAPLAETPTPRPAKPSDMCGADELAGLVGKPRTEIPIPLDPSRRRVYCTTCPVTQDYDPARLNIVYDAKTGLVAAVRCG